MKYCTNCGTQILNNKTTCPICNRQLIDKPKTRIRDVFTAIGIVFILIFLFYYFRFRIF